MAQTQASALGPDEAAEEAPAPSFKILRQVGDWYDVYLRWRLT